MSNSINEVLDFQAEFIKNKVGNTGKVISYFINVDAGLAING